LAGALFSATQLRVLGLLFDQAGRSFTISDLILLAHSGSGAVQRELARLTESGLVEAFEIEGRRKYRARRSSPIFEELRSIIEKTVGVVGQLRAAFESTSAPIRFAMLFGSVAKGADRAESDIDVLIVSDDMRLEDAYRLLGPIEERTRRKVSPTILTTKEFESRRRSGNPFLKKILAGPHVVLVGEEDDLEGTRRPGKARQAQG
jgi:predicted nucleotidyltransferase